VFLRVIRGLSLEMQIDFLIVGQGICGTFLSWYLEKEKQNFIVIDNNDPQSASRVAAGIINPVTGRRIVTTWMIDEVMPSAWEAYNEMSIELEVIAISQKNIIDFFPNEQMREIFIERLKEDDKYLNSFPDQNHFRNHFVFDFGCGEIRPSYTVHLEDLLPAWRKKLQENNQLLEEDFDIEQLQIRNNKVIYKNFEAEKIIYCDGIKSFENPLFTQLPFSFNKGEVLIIEAGDLPKTHTFKKGVFLSPMLTKGLFWVGSNYIWEYQDATPTKKFRDITQKFLKSWLKVPFEIVDHKAAIRPATLERRPFVGLHPAHPNIGILNGMGTKGCSLAPYFAKQLVQHLLFEKPIHAEADLRRFEKILSRTIS
jgi:glycine/D-amino acid oxidase-like deaminating enzyme